MARKGTGTLEVGGPDSKSVLYAFAPLSSAVDTGLSVAISVPVSSLYTKADRMLALQFAAVWLLTLLALCFVWFGSSAFIIRPVKAMVRTAQRLSRGDLDARTGLPHQRSELGSLARALDEMAEALETRALQVQEYEGQLRSMASRLTRAEERERRRIAEGLHDRVGQLLGLSKIKMGFLQQTDLEPEAARLGEEIRDLIAEALQETRLLTFEISPPVLYEIGLEAALEYLAERVQAQHGLPVTYTVNGQPKALDEDVRVFLYRAAHELLSNVVKHAKARRVLMATESRDNRIVLSVEDDGAGFDPEQEASSCRGRQGYGLFSLRERLTHAGGQLTIESAPGKGCRVVLTMPLQEQNPENT
jgi:signal transduction histidine kinase